MSYEISQTFEFYLQHKSKSRATKRCLSISVPIILLLVVATAVAIYVNFGDQLGAISGAFHDMEYFNLTQVGKTDNVMVLIGGRNPNNHKVNSIVEVFGENGKWEKCHGMPKNLPRQSDYVNAQGSIAKQGATLSACFSNPKVTLCRTYNRYNKTRPWTTDTKLFETSIDPDFNAFTVGNYFIVKSADGKLIGFHPLTNNVTPLADDDGLIVSGACHVVDGEDVLVTGGVADDGRAVLAYRAQFQAEHKCFVKGVHVYPDMPTDRRFHGCTKFNSIQSSYLAVAGGISNGNNINSVHIIKANKPTNTDDFRWMKLPDLPTPRHHYPSLGVLGSTVVIAGGNEERNFDVFDVEKAKWKKEKKFQIYEARLGHSTAFFAKHYCSDVRGGFRSEFPYFSKSDQVDFGGPTEGKGKKKKKKAGNDRGRGKVFSRFGQSQHSYNQRPLFQWKCN